MNEYVSTHVDQAKDLLRQGHLSSAHFALKKALRGDPANRDALILRAELLLRKGKRTESEDLIDRLFGMQTESFSVEQQTQLGSTCFANELYTAAIKLLEWAGEKEALDSAALYQLGVSYRRLGNMSGAEHHLTESISLAPDIPAPYLQLAHVHKALGRVDQAAHFYKKFISLSKPNIGTGYWCLADLKSFTFSDEEIAAMEDALEATRNNPSQHSALHFALGSAAENSEDYARAMSHYKEGNSLHAKLRPFNAKQYRNIIDGLQVVPAGESQYRNDTKPVAILIVGLPRSGTTLIEQILSAHSKVQPTDELPFLERTALRLEMGGGYPQSLVNMTDDERNYLGQQYIGNVSAYLRQDCDFFIDKYPGNFLHVGLIKRIMPASIIIDVRRDPRDIAISAYRQRFNVRNEFAASFDGIYEYYKGYLRMIRHWKSVYPGQVRSINYEQLVSSPLEEIRRLLEYCGLDCETGCIEFYNHRRAVTTPSVAQVSQPMYTSSIGQWRKFEKFVPDEMSRLASLIDDSTEATQ